MRLVLIFCLLGFSISSCAQKRKHEPNTSKDGAATTISSAKQTQLNTSKIALIKFNQTSNWPFDKNYKPISLTKKELFVTDSLLQLCIKNYNNRLAEDKKDAYSIDSKKYNYKLQFVAVINNQGEKEVWVNGFCDQIGRNNDWKKEIVQVKDGGNCYFNLKINLNTKSCSGISVNGYA